MLPLGRPCSSRILAAACIFGLVPPASADDGDELVEAIRAAFAAPPDTAAPYRCVTPLAAEAHEQWKLLTPEQRAEIVEIIVPQGLQSTYLSPSGLFSLNYTTAGPDSVPIADDNPANGVPDFVERCAEYADLSWAQEVGTLGFAAPALPADGSYDLSFRGLGGGFYGYAYVDGPTTAIVLNSTFMGAFGWPGPTDDPDGDQLGRAKVTIAHEFKHASQFTNNGWTEGAWVEIDAMWIEDIVFPVVDEYQYWVDNNSMSQLDAPWVPLDNLNGQGNYEDCMWQHYLSGTWGDSCIVQLWNRRALYPTEPMTASYAATLALYSSDWPDAYASYLEWCWFTGSRAEPPFGFPDAAELWRMELVAPHITSYPSTQSGTVPPLAGHPRRYSVGNATGSPRIVFDASDGSDAVLSVIVKRYDDTFVILRPSLPFSRSYDAVIQEPWSLIHYVGVLVTNGAPGSSPVDYTLDVLDDTAVGVSRIEDPAIARLTASPNPSRGRVRFTLEARGGLQGPLRITDVHGRSVARVGSRSEADRCEVSWDGRDAQGRVLAPGVYWVIAETGSGDLVRKIALVR